MATPAAVTPHATRYHRLARETPAHRWWRLPVAALLILVIYLGLTTLLVGAAAAWFATPATTSTFDDWIDAIGELDLAKLDFFVLDMLSLALLIPSVLLGVLATGPRPIGYLSSVTGRLRWGWLGVTGLIAAAVFTITIGASLAITELTDPADVSAPDPVDERVIWAIVAVLLVVPLQSAAEEYLFRGYLMQLVGSWSRFAIVPVLVTTPLFVAGHGYELWGMVDVGIFGLTAAILTIRTGGLEAAIAAHVANNVSLFLLDALGMIEATDDSGAGPVDVLPTVASSVLMVVLVEWAARRRGLQRTREPIPEPVPPQLPMWPPPPYAMVWYYPPAAREAPRLHAETPEYPGELPPDWNG